MLSFAKFRCYLCARKRRVGMKINPNSLIFYAPLRKLLLDDSIQDEVAKNTITKFPLLNVLSLNIKILDKQVPSVFNKS